MQKNSSFFEYLLCFGYLFQYFTHSSGSLIGDSHAYAYGNRIEWDLLSFLGHSIRNWPIVLINCLIHNTKLQALFQILLALVSWLITIRTIRKYCRIENRIIAQTLVVIFALTPNVLNFHSLLLSESQSLSLILIGVNLLVRAEITKKANLYYLCCIIFWLWGAIQPRNWPLSLLFTFISIVRVHDKKVSNKYFASILVILFSWSAIVNVNQSNQLFTNNIKYKAIASFYIFGNQPESEVVRKHLHGVEEMRCLLSYDTNDVQKTFAIAEENCKGSIKWLENNFTEWYINFLVKNPDIALKMIAFGVLAGNTETTFYAGISTPLPSFLSNTFFGNRESRLPDKKIIKTNLDSNDLHFSAPILLWIFSYLLLLFNKIKRIPQSNINLKLKLIGLLSLTMISINILLNPSEYLRMTIQGYQLLFICTLLLCSLNDLNRTGIEQAVD